MIPNHSHLIMSAAGVWQLEPEVCILYTLWTRSWSGGEGPENTYNSTILFLMDANSPRNFDRPPEAHWKSTNNATSTEQPGQHQKAQNDISDIPSHPHHNHTTYFVRGWRKSTSTQSS